MLEKEDRDREGKNSNLKTNSFAIQTISLKADICRDLENVACGDFYLAPPVTAGPGSNNSVTNIVIG
jgi:hypothetical protein